MASLTSTPVLSKRRHALPASPSSFVSVITNVSPYIRALITHQSIVQKESSDDKNLSSNDLELFCI